MSGKIQSVIDYSNTAVYWLFSQLDKGLAENVLEDALEYSRLDTIDYPYYTSFFKVLRKVFKIEASLYKGCQYFSKGSTIGLKEPSYKVITWS